VAQEEKGRAHEVPLSCIASYRFRLKEISSRIHLIPEKTSCLFQIATDQGTQNREKSDIYLKYLTYCVIYNMAQFLPFRNQAWRRTGHA
jgi:hypothetical protein